ncbi:MAG TPA: TonB-dependent receptor [Kofleriaceae bacterium]|nr:TonB-dependent receptor [Kofleriaceae bacterium]
MVALVTGALTLVPRLARADDPSETIVVVDPLGPRPHEDEAASASVITADRAPRSAETMADLLDAVPGVAVSRLGGVAAPALLSLRGSTWEQVSVYLDGVDLNLASGGGVDLSTLPIGDVARVEVYRGVTPIAYGGSAIGGVVAIETRRPEATGATIEAGGGSFGTWLEGGTVAVVGDGYGLYVGLHALGTAGDFTFVDDKGTSFDPSDDQTVARRNNQSRELDGAVRGYLTLPGDRELSVIALGFARDQGLPGYPRFATTRSRLTTERGVATLAYQSRDELGPTSLLRAQLYGYGLEQQLRDPLGELVGVHTDERDRTFALGAVARARWAPADWLAPAILLDARRESFTPVELLSGEHGGLSTRLSGVAGAETALRIAALDLAILPSLRLETSRDIDAGRNNFGRFVPPGPPITRALPIARLGITQSPGDGVTLRANLGHYERLPTFLELYGNTGFVLGNRDLEPEHGTTADLGGALAWARGGARLVLDAAAFAVLTDQLIEFQQNTAGVARARNIGSARVLGAESSAELGYGIARLHAQATLTDARDESDSAADHDKQLPYRPRVHVTVRPELRGIAIGGAELGGYVELDVTSGNYVDPANLVAIPTRTRIAAGASLGFDRGRVRLIVSADNLTGAQESDLLDYPLPGRAFYVTVALATEPQPKEP